MPSQETTQDYSRQKYRENDSKWEAERAGRLGLTWKILCLF